MISRFAILLCAALAGCGVVYYSPSVKQNDSEGLKVRVAEMTAESALAANRSPYTPRDLPSVFYQTAAVNPRDAARYDLPTPAVDPQIRPAGLERRLPPETAPAPYTIGVGDVVILATPQVGTTVDQLAGLLAAQTKRQGYTVQDDGSISIPNVGRVQLAGLTIDAAEAALFQKLVDAKIDPSFSLEISEFNSQKVTIGGSVRNPHVVPITLSPLYLDEALSAVGGVTSSDLDYAMIRIYRDGKLYQVPLKDFYAKSDLPRILLRAGDSVYVDDTYDLDKAQAYFAQQIQLANFSQNARTQALNALNLEFTIRRASLNDQKDAFKTRADLGAEPRDYVYLTGEVKAQTRFPLPYGQKATLADALYANGGFDTRTGSPGQIYVLRSSPDPADFAGITAWHLDARNAVNMVLATRFELRPNDVIFIAEQPVTKWNRVVSQITTQLIVTGGKSASNL